MRILWVWDLLLNHHQFRKLTLSFPRGITKQEATTINCQKSLTFIVYFPSYDSGVHLSLQSSSDPSGQSELPSHTFISCNVQENIVCCWKICKLFLQYLVAWAVCSCVDISCTIQVRFKLFVPNLGEKLANLMLCCHKGNFQKQRELSSIVMFLNMEHEPKWKCSFRINKFGD